MPDGLLEQVLNILVPALATLIAGWFAVLGAKIKTVYTNKINTQTKKEVAEITANYVQQVFYSLNGEEKLQKAMEQASLILTEKGIPVSDIELRTLIESAVYGIKKGFYETEQLTDSVTKMLEASTDVTCDLAEDSNEEKGE